MTKATRLRILIGMTLTVVSSAGCQTSADVSKTSSTTSSQTAGTTGLVDESTSSHAQSVKRSSTSLGRIQWTEVTGVYPTATRFRLDGRYYAESEQGWWSSTDGVAWSELARAPESVPAEFSAPGSNFEVFEDDGETWATLASTFGPLRLFFHRQGGQWVEAPVRVPHPPSGALVKSGLGTITVPGGGGFRRAALNDSTVVMIHFRLMTVPEPNGAGSGMVALYDSVYGVSLEPEVTSPSGFTLWRSDDGGGSWEPVELPDITPDVLSWAYLTSGHGRLMLSVGAPQQLWTSSDGVEWERVEMPEDFSFPAPPQPTDFGWMITTLGEPYDDGLYDPDKFRLLVSSDGLDWEQRNAPGPPSGFVAGPPTPLDYQGDLFVRRWNFTVPTIWTGRFAE